MRIIDQSNQNEYREEASITNNLDGIAYPLESPIVLSNFVFKEFYPNQNENHQIRFFTTESFYFVYTLSGSLTFWIKGNIKKLRAHESCVLYDPLGKGIALTSGSSHKPKFMIIGIHNQDEVPCFEKFKYTFSLAPTSHLHYYMGKTNLQITDKVNVLSHYLKAKEKNEFIMEGLLFHIYGLKLIQMVDENKTGFQKFGGFSPKEVEQISMLSQTITANPSKDYSIKSLCHLSGIGPNKLQKGFKKMHGKTIVDYIRTKRLEKALELMKTTNLSVSEIVYSVGFSSRSYFSKIFKIKYKCSPRQFQRSQKI